MKANHRKGDRFVCNGFRKLGVATIIKLTKNSVTLQFERDQNSRPFTVTYTIEQFEGWLDYPEQDRLIKIVIDVNKIWKELNA